MNSIKYMRVSMQKNKTCKVMDMKKKKKKTVISQLKKRWGIGGRGRRKANCW